MSRDKLHTVNRSIKVVGGRGYFFDTYLKNHCNVPVPNVIIVAMKKKSA